jgi:hypothetical protein
MLPATVAWQDWTENSNTCKDLYIYLHFIEENDDGGGGFEVLTEFIPQNLLI